MPFPWTKKRATRISRLVADLHSPKRGGSLVVETGFPTSLIDLFVKNRNRFRKPKSKKPVRREISDPPHPLPPKELPETPSSRDFKVVCADSSAELVTGSGYRDDGVANSGQENDGSVSKTVLSTFWKMLVVVVLMFIVEKVTVGITVSAFTLVFLEYAGKRVVLFSNANVEKFNFFTRGVSGCVWFQKLQLKIKDCEGENIVVSDSLSFEEIEVVENKNELSVCSLETSFAGPKLDCSEVKEGSNGKVVGSCEISLCENKGSRSVKLKSKMKKLLPKKLRGSWKERKEKRDKENKTETNSEGLSTVEQCKTTSFEIEEEQREKVESEDRSALLLKTKLEYMKEDEVDHVDVVTFSHECSMTRVEVVVNREEEIIDRVGNSGYIILFVIALVGLVLGRLPALMLMMTWCFTLKIVTRRGRSKVPLMNCSIPKS